MTKFREINSKYSDSRMQQSLDGGTKGDGMAFALTLSLRKR